MLMGKLGMTKSTPSKKQDLLRWGSPTKGEKWINLTATYITDKDKEYPCGQKGKKQKPKLEFDIIDDNIEEEVNP